MLIWAIFQVVQAKVIYFVEVSRHGARAPNELMPWDSKDRWNDGAKSLLPEGMRQHYLIGRYIRDRYISEEPLLSESYNNSEILIYSTGISRTQLSAFSQILGIYPQSPFESSPLLTATNLGLVPYPIPAPIKIDVLSVDAMLLSQDHCRFYKAYTSKQKKKAAENILKQHPKLIKPIIEYFNVSSEEAYLKIMPVLDSIRSNEFMGYKIPEIFDREWVKEAEKTYLEYRAYQRYNTEYLRRFAGSMFFLQIIQQIDQKLAGELNRKATIYSAHDTSIMNIFATLAVNLSEQPPFASIVLFELLEENSEPFVRLVYNDKPILVPGCYREKCRYSVFREYIMGRVMRNVTEACINIQNIKEGFIELENPDELSEFFIFADLLILILVIFVIYKYKVG